MLSKLVNSLRNAIGMEDRPQQIVASLSMLQAPKTRSQQSFNVLVNGLAGIQELQECTSESEMSDGHPEGTVADIEPAEDDGEDEIPVMKSDDDDDDAATEIVQVATNTPTEANIVEDLNCPEFAVTEIETIDDWPARMRKANYTAE